MNRVKEILMRRDELTEDEAEALIEECREALYDGDYEATEYILGLEPDYIFDII